MLTSLHDLNFYLVQSYLQQQLSPTALVHNEKEAEAGELCPIDTLLVKDLHIIFVHSIMQLLPCAVGNPQQQ